MSGVTPLAAAARRLYVSCGKRCAALPLGTGASPQLSERSVRRIEPRARRSPRRKIRSASARLSSSTNWRAATYLSIVTSRHSVLTWTSLARVPPVLGRPKRRGRVLGRAEARRHQSITDGPAIASSRNAIPRNELTYPSVAYNLQSCWSFARRSCSREPSLLCSRTTNTPSRKVR